MEKAISIRKIVEDLNLNVISGEEMLDTEIVLLEIHRPGVELTGYFGTTETDKDIENSIHIITEKELKYINSLPKNLKEYNMIHYFSYDFPCAIVTQNLTIPEEIQSAAKVTGKPFLMTSDSADKFEKKLKKYLEKELAPEIVLRNFILLEVFGTGIILAGDDSAKIGTTIDLLEKGHRFITEELLVIKRISDDVITGENGYNRSDEDYNYFLQLLNNQKLNIIDYFGIGSIRNSKQIDMIIKFEKWDDTKFYDRLGVEEETQYLLGVNIPKITLPVRKGRNMGIIVETAAINQRLKRNGENSALFFLEETKKLIKENAKRKSGDNMENTKSISVRKLRERFELEIISGKELVDEKKIHSSEIHRPSLEFTGFFDILEEGGVDRIQIIGQSEMAYINKVGSGKVSTYLDQYLSYNFACIVFAGVKEIPQFLLEKAVEKGVVILYTEEKANSFAEGIVEYLEKYFAPSMSMHGVLVEVFGFGVLITGKSGIGKSETALELIHRGHRLIADDMVKLTKYPDGRIIGTAEKIPYFMEIRGLGIIDIKTLYGLGAVRKSKQLDVIIELKELKDDEYLPKGDYQEEEFDILEEKVTKVDLLISSGRNAASMVEIATMNLRAKRVGYDSTEIYMKNYETMRKITNSKKENIFQNIGNLIGGGKVKK